MYLSERALKSFPVPFCRLVVLYFVAGSNMRSHEGFVDVSKRNVVKCLWETTSVHYRHLHKPTNVLCTVVFCPSEANSATFIAHLSTSIAIYLTKQSTNAPTRVFSPTMLRIGHSGKIRLRFINMPRKTGRENRLVLNTNIRRLVRKIPVKKVRRLIYRAILRYKGCFLYRNGLFSNGLRVRGLDIKSFEDGSNWQRRLAKHFVLLSQKPLSFDRHLYGKR